MRCENIDYGMKIIVHSKCENELFRDMADRQRYISTIARMICKRNNVCAEPLIGGLKKNAAYFVFRGGTEEYFKKIIQKTHVSYSSYRRIKNFPISFGKTEFLLLEDENSIKNAVSEVNNVSEYICPRLKGECDIILSVHTVSPDMKKRVRNLDCDELLHAVKYLRNCHELSYREIGKLMDCSSSKIYRIVNK